MYNLLNFIKWVGRIYDGQTIGIMIGTLYQQGRAYTVTEYRTWMKDVGAAKLRR